jgi:hypothetical protein
MSPRRNQIEQLITGDRKPAGTRRNHSMESDAMNRIIETIKRTTRIAAVGAVALTMLPGSVGAAGTEPVDLGAVLFMPADAAAIGYDDYGVDLGGLFSVQQLVQKVTPDAEIDAEEFETYGIEAVTNLILDPIQGTYAEDDPFTSFYSVATLYTDDDAAAVDFDSIRDDYASDDAYEVLDDDAGVGDDSLMVREVYEEDGRSVTMISIDFVIDNIEAEVSVIGYDVDVDEEVVADAAAVVESKVTSLLDSGEIDGAPAPNLSLSTPRYEGDDLVAGRSEYAIYDGQAIVSAYDVDTADVLQARAEQYGIVAQYVTSLEFQMGDDLDETDPLLRPRATLFESAADAERYVENRADDLAETSDVANIEELDVPTGTYEDGAITALTYDWSDQFGDYEITRVFVQDGTSVYDLSLTGFTAPDLDVVLSMLDDAVACGQGGCVDTLQPPAELMNWFGEQRDYWLTELDGGEQ